MRKKRNLMKAGPFSDSNIKYRSLSPTEALMKL